MQLSEFCDLSHSERKFLSFADFFSFRSKISEFFVIFSGPNQKRTKKPKKNEKSQKNLTRTGQNRGKPGKNRARTGQEPGKNRGRTGERFWRKKWPKLAIFRKKSKILSFLCFFLFFRPKMVFFLFFPRKHRKREILGDLSQCLVDGDGFHQKGKSGMGFQPS